LSLPLIVLDDAEDELRAAVEPTALWVVAFAHHRRRPGYWKS